LACIVSHRHALQIGYGRWHIFNATHIFYEFLGLESRAQEDSFWLIKE
jgi:hypothetical protein